MSSTKFVFLGLIRKTRWPPWLLIGWDIFAFSETAERNSMKLDSTSSTKFVFFRPVRKTRWLPWPLIGWDIFDLSSETAERNSKKLDRKQDLNVLYQVCVFWANWKNKMASLASDWLRHFRLLLWISWTQFNETWQEARSQRLLPSLCFSVQSENKMAALASDWLRHFRFSSESAERNSMKLDRKQDLNWLNVLYQVCVFWADQKNKMAAPVSHWLRHFRLFLWNTKCNSTEVDRKQDLNIRPISKQNWPPWPICQKGGTLYSGACYVALWASCSCTDVNQMLISSFDRYQFGVLIRCIFFMCICDFIVASHSNWVGLLLPPYWGSKRWTQYCGLWRWCCLGISNLFSVYVTYHRVFYAPRMEFKDI